MTRLKFYEVEREKFPSAIAMHFCDEQAISISKKLLRHFGVKSQRYCKITFRGRGGARAFYGWFWGIKFPHNPDLLMICHEAAHLVNQVKYHNPGHNKKLMQTIKRMLTYAKKKNYLLEEKAKQK